jgi:glucoamylase
MSSSHSRRVCWQLLSLAIVFLCSRTALRAETLDEWLATERPTAARKLLGAIGRNGAVVASPDETTPVQNYYFHWIRDGALTMNVVVTFYEHAPDDEDRDEYAEILESYVKFSKLNQTAPQNCSPVVCTGLGEPKFLVNGTVFTGQWGRPQNDGPALRSVTICRWANLLLNEQSNHPLVDEELKVLVKTDLAYVRDHWSDPCTDLWEEEWGKHFYTQMVQRKALVEGADFLDRIGGQAEQDLAASCRTQVAPLEAAISQHFDNSHPYIVETLEASGVSKPSQLDAAVILASLHGETAGQPFFSPADDRVLATATALHDAFAAQYAINQPANSTDDNGEPMEAAIGRYPEDNYNGADDHGGNPWFLTTAAFAELAYRVRAILGAAASVTVTARNRPYLLAALNATGGSANIAVGEAIAATDPRFAAIASGLELEGDRFLRRLRRHSAADGSLSEQFKKDDGFMTSAVDLTWSYAATVTAIDRR